MDRETVEDVWSVLFDSTVMHRRSLSMTHHMNNVLKTLREDNVWKIAKKFVKTFRD